MARKDLGISESSIDPKLSEVMSRIRLLPDDDPRIQQQKAARLQEVIEGACASAGFPATLRSHTFENAEFPAEAVAIEAIYNRLKDWRPLRGAQGILLMGKFGCGKSYLMHCIINSLLEQGMDWFYYFQFGQMIRNLWSFTKNYERERYWTNLCKSRHVFIEDLGRAPRNALGGRVTWWVDLFFEFIDRHELEQVPVVYTTNLDQGQLETLLGGAAMERLRGNCEVLVLKGPNRREVS